jgi:hypothetical protein
MRDDKDVMIIVSSWQSRDLVQANWLAVVNAFPTTLSCILYLSKKTYSWNILQTFHFVHLELEMPPGPVLTIHDCIPTIINPHNLILV